MSAPVDRLFVPLAGWPFDAFANGSKRWEVRRYGRQWTEKHVQIGRCVELRRGYSGASLWGEVSATNIGTLDGVLLTVPWREIVPTVDRREYAVDAICRILRLEGDERLIAFRVSLDADDPTASRARGVRP